MSDCSQACASKNRQDICAVVHHFSSPTVCLGACMCVLPVSLSSHGDLSLATPIRGHKYNSYGSEMQRRPWRGANGQTDDSCAGVGRPCVTLFRCLRQAWSAGRRGAGV